MRAHVSIPVKLRACSATRPSVRKSPSAAPVTLALFRPFPSPPPTSIAGIRLGARIVDPNPGAMTAIRSFHFVFFLDWEL